MAGGAKPEMVEMVSVHGGHSGEFCTHAIDTLEDVFNAYIRSGFSWVGITEHMPPAEDRWVYDDEREAGLDAQALFSRFSQYIASCKALKEKYRDRIEVFVGFETETYEGSVEFVRTLVSRFSPDYVVGSLHHVGGMEFDYSPDRYLDAAESLDGVDALYCRYFDEQYSMLEALTPSVVGHFDLIRLYDPDYKDRLMTSAVWERVERNLDLIGDQGLILDCNLRGFGKSGEPYPTRDILTAAIQRGIAIVPGDDSHGVESVARDYERGVGWLKELGADLDWKQPK